MMICVARNAMTGHVYLNGTGFRWRKLKMAKNVGDAGVQAREDVLLRAAGVDRLAHERQNVAPVSSCCERPFRYQYGP